MSIAQTQTMACQPPALWREFLRDQVPMAAGFFILGLLVCWWEFGYIPGGEQPFAVAGVRVPLWHLLWMGFWTGYTMGVVGEAAGIFSLPYSMSILQFTNLAVSPTNLIITFLNPFGALLGYWRGRQLNFHLAVWLCLGAVLGAPIGPFIRYFWLNDPLPFKAAIGLSLVIMAAHLIIQVTPWYLKRTARQRSFKEKFDAMMRQCRAEGRPPSGLPADFRIHTVRKSLGSVTIGYWGEEQTFSSPVMLAIGFLVGIAASTLGVGGGFLLVPILVSFFGLPLYVLVAASIPFVITLSVVGLLSYAVTLPLLTGASSSPDWGFGLFVACGASLGAWVASKTQKFIPERFLKPMLGVVTGVVGLLYVINYFWTLPFKV